MVVDADRAIYAAWGLGVCGYAHVLSPASFASLFRLGREKNIWNRSTESGSRWQTSGNYAVDANGVIKWGGISTRADDVPEFEEAVEAIHGGKRSARVRL